MKISPLKLERYFAKYEFSAKYLLCSSDCDGLSQKEVIAMADDETSKLWENLNLGYTESMGSTLLREEITKLYKNTTKDEVIVFTPQEGIFVTMNCILEKGDHVISTFPGYQSLYQVAKSLDCEVTLWRPEEDAGWRFDPETLEKLITPETKLLIINFPHNPTGYIPTANDFNQIIEICKKHNLYLFSDEMYRYLVLDSARNIPSASDLYEKAISLFGMSKTFGLAGIRIGWTVVKDKKLFKKMAEFKDYTTICSSAPSEILALIGLRNKDKIIKKHLDRVKRNLSILESFIERHKIIFTLNKPYGSTICFPKINLPISSFELAEKTVKEAGIMLMPSDMFDYDDKHLRIGLGRKNMPEVLEKFEEYIKSNF